MTSEEKANIISTIFNKTDLKLDKSRAAPYNKAICCGKNRENTI